MPLSLIRYIYNSKDYHTVLHNAVFRVYLIHKVCFCVFRIGSDHSEETAEAESASPDERPKIYVIGVGMPSQCYAPDNGTKFPESNVPPCKHGWFPMNYQQLDFELDADKSFLISLLPEYNKLSGEQKIDFRLCALQFFKDVNEYKSGKGNKNPMGLYEKNSCLQSSHLKAERQETTQETDAAATRQPEPSPHHSQQREDVQKVYQKFGFFSRPNY